MISIDKAIIVEGKYDKIRLQNIVDAPIICTDGFGIFKNKEKRELIRRLSQTVGIIVLTDSDSAGAMIRAHIKNITPIGEVISVYLPEIAGKERRKAKSGAAGLLGVEGTPDEIIENALLAAVGAAKAKKTPISKADLYSLGLSGAEGSRERFKSLCRYLRLPSSISANSFLEIAGLLYGREEFLREVEKWKQGSFKN